MSDFDKQLYNLGLQEVIERYLKHYFALHGDILPAEGLYASLIKEVECSLLKASLNRLKGNQLQAARLLGINRNTLRRKIESLHISLETLTNESK